MYGIRAIYSPSHRPPCNGLPVSMDWLTTRVLTAVPGEFCTSSWSARRKGAGNCCSWLCEVRLIGSNMCKPVMAAKEMEEHCCPVKSRTESVGWNQQLADLCSCSAEVPVKSAFSRTE